MTIISLAPPDYMDVSLKLHREQKNHNKNWTLSTIIIDKTVIQLYKHFPNFFQKETLKEDANECQKHETRSDKNQGKIHLKNKIVAATQTWSDLREVLSTIGV